MQHFQFYPDIRVKHLGGGTIFLGFSFYPDIRAKYLGDGNIFLGNVYNPMFFFHSMLIFVQTIWGGRGLQYISGMCIKPIAKIEWSM